MCVKLNTIRYRSLSLRVRVHICLSCSWFIGPLLNQYFRDCSGGDCYRRKRVSVKLNDTSMLTVTSTVRVLTVTLMAPTRRWNRQRYGCLLCARSHLNECHYLHVAVNVNIFPVLILKRILSTTLIAERGSVHSRTVENRRFWKALRWTSTYGAFSITPKVTRRLMK